MALYTEFIVDNIQIDNMIYRIINVAIEYIIAILNIYFPDGIIVSLLLVLICVFLFAITTAYYINIQIKRLRDGVFKHKHFG